MGFVNTSNAEPCGCKSGMAARQGMGFLPATTAPDLAAALPQWAWIAAAALAAYLLWRALGSTAAQNRRKEMKAARERYTKERAAIIGRYGRI
jgi:hypothetical protein